MLLNPLRTLRTGNGKARSSNAPDAVAIAHKGTRKGNTGKPAREYRKTLEGAQENSSLWVKGGLCDEEVARRYDV